MGPGRNVYIVPYGSYTSLAVRKGLSNKSCTSKDFEKRIKVEIRIKYLHRNQNFFKIKTIKGATVCYLGISIRETHGLKEV